MKKNNLLFLSISFSFSSLLISQNTLFQLKPQTTKTELIERENSEYFGLVPEPVTVDYSGYEPSATLKTTILPSVYDMRTTGGITSVKNQASCGSCWLFPSMGSVESRWKRLGMGEFDLSEDNLKHCHNYKYLPCEGGNRMMATAYFSRGKGPFLETQDPYSASSATGCPVGLTPVANVTEAWFLPNKSIVDIKQAIYNYGAVYNTFYWTSKWYDSSKRIYAQARDTSASNNHAVLMVGWNDTITTPLGKGVWIIKNSWGASWGDAGFFYISYQDKEAAQDPTIWVNRTDYNPKQIFHGYDDLGWNSAVGGAKTSWGVVKFTASTNQILKQIATYAVAPNSTISAEIYSNFTGSVFSGLIGSVPAKTVKYAGYYTLDVNFPVNLTAGSNFFVKYKISNNANNFPLAAESKIVGYTDNAIIETGKCWISTSNTIWTALGATNPLKYDLCLKAITEESCDFLKSIISQPLVNLCSGQTTTLIATSSLAGTNYQWQLSTNGGATWTNVVNNTKYSGAQTDKLKISSVVLAFDNHRFRCNVTSTCNSVYSNIATLRVTSSPIVTIHPIDVVTSLNTAALFNVDVSNPTNCTYQWQINTTGTTWTNLVDNSLIIGSTGNELYVQATTAYSNKKFRCRLKSTCSSTYKYSNNALLSIGSVLTPTKTVSSFKIGEEESEISIEENTLTDFVLYPNPATDLINIDYNLFNTTHVEIIMYDMLGQVAGTIVNNDLETGEHTTEFNTTTYSNGNYLIVVTMKDETGKVSKSHKRLVINH